MEVVDIPGKKYTWCRSNGKSMSKIDRILVNKEWLDKWLGASQHLVEGSISNHFPLVLKNVIMDWEPKQFRVLNCWFEDKRFDKFLEEVRSRLHFLEWELVS